MVNPAIVVPTLAMLAHAFLAVATASERDHAPAPAGLIELTVNEFRRLFDALLLGAKRTIDALGEHDAVLVVDESGDLKMACIRSGCSGTTPARPGGSRTPVEGRS
jgi:hypothetical protein